MENWNTPTQVWLGSGKFDSKGREIGYIVGFNENGSQFAAWVQNGRKENGEFFDFGVPQRSKIFGTQAEASNWAYSTAKSRIANV